MKIDISEKSDNIVVEVEIPPRAKAAELVVECDYHMVVAQLAKKGYKNLVCVAGRQLFLSNSSPESTLEGTWIFQEKQEVKPPVASKPVTRRKRASKKTTTAT